MNNDKETFDSKLGDVTVGITKISREVKEAEVWDKIREEFSEEILVVNVHYSELEDLDFDHGPMFPCIRLRVNGEWKRMFFTESDESKECFRRLAYMWSAYKQNHQ